MSKLAKALTAAAGNAGESLYVEDVFSTYLYNGTGSTQSINNGIDLDGEGGMVWSKARSASGGGNVWDTERGVRKYLETYNTSAESTSGTGAGLTSFNSDGFTLGTNWNTENFNGYNYASWTFRKAEKFFDVVTYTGTTANQVISHNLNSVPGMIIVRALSGDNWFVWHNSLSTSGAGASTGHYKLLLNSTAAKVVDNGVNTVTDSSFTVLGNNGETNSNGTSYVAYVFANDAGGFGDDGSESIIKCGSFTTDGSGNATVDLGFEPQFVIYKSSSASSSWFVYDVMRGWTAGDGPKNILRADSSAAETVLSSNDNIQLTSTGFYIDQDPNETNIYIAIRRPMKTPESGTEVFDPNYTTSNQFVTTGFPVDLQIGQYTGGGDAYWVDRLRGMSTSTTGSMQYLRSTSSNAEASNTGSLGFNGFVQNGFSHTLGNFAQRLLSFKRATGFFDVVAYTGNTTTQAINHNLGVTPELIIVKARQSVIVWAVWSKSLEQYQLLQLSTSNPVSGSAGDYGYWTSTAPTSTQFSVGTYDTANKANEGMIAYLFATLDGVSKVGSYTGTGSNVDVDCGFSAGARFILIKRTDSSGDWYVWDSVRGIVAGNDPYLLLNSTAAEVTSTDYIDPLNAGFTVTSSAPAALNASGGTYIFLAIA